MRSVAGVCVAAAMALASPFGAQDDPILIGRIEAAYAHKTPAGRQIATLQVFGGRLYAGYGDYTADAGPIAVVAVDLATGRIGPPLLQQATEAIDSYRQIGNALFAPDIDPKGTRMGGFARGIAGSPADTWTDEKVVAATHIFDVASLDGRDLWLFGSLVDDAMAWRSIDGGKTWATALTVTPKTPRAFSRLYSAFVLGGRLYTQVVDYPGGARETSMVFDGTSWAAGPRFFPPEVIRDDVFPWRPQVTGRQVIYLDQHSGTTYRDVRVYRFDGLRAHLTFGPTDRHLTGELQHAALDVTTDDGTAYVLNRLQQVWSSTDLVSWRLRATFTAAADDSATSIAVTGGDLYFGTRLSRIYKLKLSS